ncbi:MAG: hypothetical protein CBD16_01815 [Betaproteobacteria bacterium TMED156]|nr:MAG: hypothetical protein CBD16_01815 [Betaproteobacteria bacterium TMED156]|tara:strand:+ start:1104 stop:2015 length:912 start_codon:yes stop_codon:yes gene_type:complete
MKVLVLGSGGVGGYFGGRLIQAGVDVTFFVRKHRAKLLKKNGLNIESPHGDCKLRPKTKSIGDEKQNFDIVILTCKAYDLYSSLDDVLTVINGNPVYLPLLNGLAHIQYLIDRFGNNHVLAGAAHVASVLKEENVIHQLNPIQILTFGPIKHDCDKVALEFKNVCESANFKTLYTLEIMQALWNKWTFLATLAGSTTLFRSCVGKITSTDIGHNLMKRMYYETLEIAEKEDRKVHEKAQRQALEILMKKNSDFTSSMLRDLVSGNRTEHEQILGDMVRIGVRHKLDIPLLSSAYINTLSQSMK